MEKGDIVKHEGKEKVIIGQPPQDWLDEWEPSKKAENLFHVSVITKTGGIHRVSKMVNKGELEKTGKKHPLYH